MDILQTLPQLLRWYLSCPVPRLSLSGAAGVGVMVLMCSPDHSEKGLDAILPCILSRGSGFQEGLR